MYISIRTKILGVLSALLVAAIFAYLLLADRIFREDKELLVFDTNRTNAERLSADLNIALRRVLDKSETLARLVLNDRSPGASELARDFFRRDSEFLVYQVVSVEAGGKAPRVVRELVDEERLRKLKIVRSTLEIPDLHGSSGETVIENISRPGAVLFLVHVPAEVAGERSRRFAVRVVLDGREWLRPFVSQNLSQNFAVTGSGRLLTHTDPQLVVERTDMSAHELVRLAREGRMLGRQVEFEAGGHSYLGVYQKGPLGGYTVFSMIGKDLALSASLLLLEKTILLSLIVITLVMLVGMWFARGLSRPLRELVAASGEIARGRFDGHIKANSNDEIGELARAFDHMARDLKSSRLQLEDHSRSLEAKVQERTRELEGKNAAIREQQETLVRTTRLAAVGEIAGQAAHEVLNPLTGMIARLEGMRRRVRGYFVEPGAATPVLSLIVRDWSAAVKAGGPKKLLEEISGPSKIYPDRMLLEEDLANLAGAMQRLDEFSAQLLVDLELLHSESFRISRIVDGMRGLSRHAQYRARIDIGDLVTESVRVSEDQLAQDGILIRTSLEPGLFAYVDRDEMRQVFSNLMRNARDAIIEKPFSQGEKGLITIEGKHIGRSIRFLFRDNGIGLADEDRGRVFETNFSTKGAAGTGFGLGICRRFLRAAGGDVSVHESERGKFTEFEVVLPYVAADAPEEAKA